MRPWALTDLASLVNYANNPAIAGNLTDRFPYPYTEQNGRDFIAFATGGQPAHIFAIDINGEAVGGIGLHPQNDIYRKNVELGYWLAEPFWGKGIVTAAVRRIVDHAFKHYDVERVFARPFGHNTASQKVLQKAGFLLEGRFEKTLFKNGEFVDELVYALRRKNWQPLPNGHFILETIYPPAQT